MQRMHIGGIDLNLAFVLHVLLEERNVSRAALRLGLSQSATSHALARLRHLLDDPVFVRTPSGLVPTARAEAMAGGLTAALSSIESAFFAPPQFDPSTAKRAFQIGSSDYAEHVILPSLLADLATTAPNMDIRTKPASIDVGASLAQGEIDLHLGPRPLSVGERASAADNLRAVDLWEDHFVVVMRRDHPLSRGKLTLGRFAAATHAFIAPRGRPGGVVDDALAKRGLTRRIAFVTPNFLVAPSVVARTDLVITLASRVAETFAGMLPLVMLPPPIELEGFRVAMYWHERRHTDPAHRFLRGGLTKAARTLPTPASERPAKKKSS